MLDLPSLARGYLSPTEVLQLEHGLLRTVVCLTSQIYGKDTADMLK